MTRHMIPLITFSVLIFLSGSTPAFGAEASVASGVDPWIDLAVKVIVGVAGLLLSVALVWLQRQAVKRKAIGDAIEAIGIGADQVYLSFVKKHKSLGTWNIETQAQARALAIDSARKLAEGKALQVLNSTGAVKLTSWLQRQVAKRKAARQPKPPR